jgi:hypothetical protein
VAVSGAGAAVRCSMRRCSRLASLAAGAVMAGSAALGWGSSVRSAGRCQSKRRRGVRRTLANQHMNQVPEHVRSLAPEIPLEVDDAIAAALAKHPADRPSMNELEKVFTAAESAVLRLPLSPSAEPCEHRVNQITSGFRVPGKSTVPVLSRRVDEAGDSCWESIAYERRGSAGCFSAEPELSGSAMRRNRKQSGSRTQLNLASASDDEPPELGLDGTRWD